MKIDTQVISREMIKPSTPTPNHLRHYQFSFLDQTSPPTYIPLIYFFINDEKLSNNDISKALKLSLSKVLCHYYPLAGCVKDNYVDCNDKGVLVFEAQVSCTLAQSIQEPVLSSELNKFLPTFHQEEGLALVIQVNFFKCGGVAISALISHRIADGSSYITFIKNWAATSRGDRTNNISELFVAATLFPPKDVGGIAKETYATEKNLVYKRFVFSGSAIAALREKYAQRISFIYPTRVEALSSFTWSRLVSSTGIKIGPDRPCMFFYPVNLRKRMDQPLSDDSFGNMVGTAVTILSESTEEECYVQVKKLRDATSKMKDYVKSLQNGHNELLDLMKTMEERIKKGELVDLVAFGCSSLCRYPVYEADFGWGRPTWVAFGGFPYTNLVVLMETKCGDGIEAWIHLKPEDMAKFEADKELLAYVSPA